MSVAAKPALVRDISVQRLVSLDAKVDKAEGEGVEARWEFGKELLTRRVGKKQLPPRYIEQVVEATGKSERELQRRMQCAECFPTIEEVRHALRTYGSWRRLVNEGLSDRGQEERNGSKPVVLGTDRQRQVAEGAKQRAERVVGTCNGLARGLQHIKLPLAVAVATPEELAGWDEAFRDAQGALGRLRKQIKEFL